MKLIAEYRKLADEYRKLSDKLARPTDRHALELMGRAWESAAAQRKDRLISQAVRELLDRICQETVG
jgi:hypothetical protein